MTRLLVVGGGIAGTGAALALHKAGLDVAVYEAHPGSAEDIGAFLTLASNGMRALAEVDASAAVTSIGFPLTSMRVLDDTGAEAARMPLGEAGTAHLRYRCVRRGDLNSALQAEVTRRGIGIRHGTRLVSVDEGPDGVTAHFADGTTATGDLLIGADGLNSTVRRLVTPDARPDHAGQQVFYGYTREAPAAGEPETITMVRGSSVAFGYAVSPEGETYWFARVAAEPLAADEIEHGTPAHWRDLLLPLLRKDTTPAADLVEATADDLMVTNASELPTTTWRSGRTLLIGDAAHAASPATGQGASMALEDAVVLAKSLRDAPDTDAALARYETLRRPRVEHNITVSGNISRGTHAPSGPGPRGASANRPGDEELLRQLDWDTDLWRPAS
ncbi:FAD-dependent oxidoreductase [Streptomyces sp. NPDC056479]|uniref:FAD-dependent oxidoreductase n=1 Tax=Streptomyces sp. NPDC056479 TaxID=3345832 RepID=UPI0036AF42A4